MKYRNEDKDTIIGPILLLLFFFLLLFTLSGRTDRTSFTPDKGVITVGIQSKASDVIAGNTLRIPEFRKSWITSTDRMNFHFFTEQIRQDSGNLLIAQSLHSNQYHELEIGSRNHFNLFYHFFYPNTKELPFAG
jgi:hypothetical protein